MLDRYAPLLCCHPSDFAHGQPLPRELLLAEDRQLEVYYAPFDFVNPKAKVVLVGITPGLQQAVNALNAARRGLLAGHSPAAVSPVAKNTGSFSGPLRRNLVAMLDYIGLPSKLGLQSCEELFSSAVEKVHFTSMLRYPVFKDGQDYNGTPAVIGHPLLEAQVRQYLIAELQQMPDAVIVPLGPKVQSVLSWLVGQGAVNEARVLAGMPHPSGANAERVAYFLGRKPKEQLSAKTNADALDRARRQLLEKVAHLSILA